MLSNELRYFRSKLNVEASPRLEHFHPVETFQMRRSPFPNSLGVEALNEDFPAAGVEETLAAGREGWPAVGGAAVKLAVRASDESPVDDVDQVTAVEGVECREDV